MAQIKVEFDNTLEKSEIIVPLVSSSPEQAGDNYNDGGRIDKMQTSVFGIQVPLIQINSTVIDYDAVQSFSLKSVGVLPELTMIVEDRYELLTNLDKPKNDNEVRVQIIPKFDNAYKKVDLTFYINNINVSGKSVKLNCSYKLPSFTSTKFIALGELDTYTMFKTAAQENKLGFATNVGECSDIRYTYLDNKSWMELLRDEIQYSGKDPQVFDWWIDFWDNINLADVYERYNAVDPEDDLKVWVANQVNEVSTDEEVKAMEVPAIIHNHPAQSNSEMFVVDYSIQNNPGAQVSKGSDRVYSIYEDGKYEYLDYLVQDGDVKKDIFARYEYLGEVMGEHNYLLQKELRSCFLQKMMTDKIKVTLKSPLLGLMRGHKVKFVRYVNDDKTEAKMKNLEDVGVVDRNVESNSPLNEFEMTEDMGTGKFVVDRTVSGQYLINDIDIQYDEGWKYILTLVRPADIAPDVVKEE